MKFIKNTVVDNIEAKEDKKLTESFLAIYLLFGKSRLRKFFGKFFSIFHKITSIKNFFNSSPKHN